MIGGGGGKWGLIEGVFVYKHAVFLEAASADEFTTSGIFNIIFALNFRNIHLISQRLLQVIIFCSMLLVIPCK